LVGFYDFWLRTKAGLIITAPVPTRQRQGLESGTQLAQMAALGLQLGCIKTT